MFLIAPLMMRTRRRTHCTKFKAPQSAQMPKNYPLPSMIILTLLLNLSLVLCGLVHICHEEKQFHMQVFCFSWPFWDLSSSVLCVQFQGSLLFHLDLFHGLRSYICQSSLSIAEQCNSKHFQAPMGPGPLDSFFCPCVVCFVCMRATFKQEIGSSGSPAHSVSMFH